MCLCGKKFSEVIFSDFNKFKQKTIPKIRDGLDLCGQ